MNLMKMSSQHMAKNVHCQNKELSFPVRESALEEEREAERAEEEEEEKEV